MKRGKPLVRKTRLDSGSSPSARSSRPSGGSPIPQGQEGSSFGRGTAFTRTPVVDLPRTPAVTRTQQKGLASQTVAKPRPRATQKGLRRKPRRSPSSKKVTATEEETACRSVVAKRSGGFCETCGEPGALDKAHRVARSQGGEWRASNILDLCRRCHHDEHHAHPAQAYERSLGGGGWHLHSGANPLVEPVLLHKGSRYDWALLDDNGKWSWLPAA